MSHIFNYPLVVVTAGEHGFLLPREQIEPTAEETAVGLFAMAKEVLKKYRLKQE